MAVVQDDETILWQANQVDWWTSSHVMVPFFLMQTGLPWYWVLLIVYLWEGFEASQIIQNKVVSNTVQDGLIVDPTQAIMGIVTFLLLRHFQAVPVHAYDKTQKNPLFKFLLFNFLFFVPILVNGIILWVYTYHHNDWSFVIVCGIMSFYNAYEIKSLASTQSVRKIAATPIYVLAFTSIVVLCNRVKFNPWFGSIIFHTPIFLIFLYINIPSILAFLAVTEQTAETKELL